MPKPGLGYYILFANYEQGLELHELLLSKAIPNRIAPTPRAAHRQASCGMSVLVAPDWIEATRQTIDQHQAAYQEIVCLENQICPTRDKYC